MNKTTKRIFSIILVACILTTGMGAFALEKQTVSPMWTTINALTAGITVGALGYAACSASVEITSSSNTATLYMYLQRYVSGSWTNVYSWNASGSGDVNIGSHYYLTSGYYYRVHAIAYIFNSGTLLETATQDSTSVYY